MTWTIRVPKWDKFQHYKDRSPTWIKLYRELSHRRAWRDLSGPAAKLLIDVWMLAAESKDGKVSLPLVDMAWRLRLDVDAMRADLETLRVCEFVELASTPVPIRTEPSGGARPEERRGETEQRESSVASLPATADAEETNGGNPMAVLGPLIREHLYVHDGQPPAGYNARRCADICTKLVRSGRYTTDDLREAILVIPRLRATGAGASDSLRRWFAKQGKLTMRALTDHWGSGSVLEQLLHIVRKAEGRAPSRIGAILNRATSRAQA